MLRVRKLLTPFLFLAFNRRSLASLPTRFKVIQQHCEFPRHNSKNHHMEQTGHTLQSQPSRAVLLERTHRSPQGQELSNFHNTRRDSVKTGVEKVSTRHWGEPLGLAKRRQALPERNPLRNSLPETDRDDGRRSRFRPGPFPVLLKGRKISSCLKKVMVAPCEVAADPAA
jgi:hypothetical protein